MKNKNMKPLFLKQKVKKATAAEEGEEDDHPAKPSR